MAIKKYVYDFWNVTEKDGQVIAISHVAEPVVDGIFEEYRVGQNIFVSYRCRIEFLRLKRSKITKIYLPYKDEGIHARNYLQVKVEGIEEELKLGPGDVIIEENLLRYAALQQQRN